jgi:hypothetical protein
MSGVPLLSAEMRQLGEERGATGDLDAYEEAMKPIDAVNYLPHVAPNALFLQFGNEDTRPSPEQADEVEAAASSPKQAKPYDGGHELNDQALAERTTGSPSASGLADAPGLTGELEAVAGGVPALET